MHHCFCVQPTPVRPSWGEVTGVHDGGPVISPCTVLLYPEPGENTGPSGDPSVSFVTSSALPRGFRLWVFRFRGGCSLTPASSTSSHFTRQWEQVLPFTHAPTLDFGLLVTTVTRLSPGRRHHSCVHPPRPLPPDPLPVPVTPTRFDRPGSSFTEEGPPEGSLRGRRRKGHKTRPGNEREDLDTTKRPSTVVGPQTKESQRVPESTIVHDPRKPAPRRGWSEESRQEKEEPPVPDRPGGRADREEGKTCLVHPLFSPPTRRATPYGSRCHGRDSWADRRGASFTSADAPRGFSPRGLRLKISKSSYWCLWTLALARRVEFGSDKTEDTIVEGFPTILSHNPTGKTPVCFLAETRRLGPDRHIGSVDVTSPEPVIGRQL